MSDHLRSRIALQQFTGPAGVVNVDVGEQDIVEALDLQPFQLFQQYRDRRKGTGVDDEAEILIAIKPAADELPETDQRGLIQIDAGEAVTHLYLLPAAGSRRTPLAAHRPLLPV